jgi:hypothetical protein
MFQNQSKNNNILFSYLHVDWAFSHEWYIDIVWNQGAEENI